METKSPADVAAEHASAVAREVVRAGLAEMEPVRKLFSEYTDLVKQHGPKGTLTQLLLARGVIDRSAFDRLQSAVPPSGLTGTGASQVVRIPSGAIPAPGSDRLPATPASNASQVARLPRPTPPSGR